MGAWKALKVRTKGLRPYLRSLRSSLRKGSLRAGWRELRAANREEMNETFSATNKQEKPRKVALRGEKQKTSD